MRHPSTLLAAGGLAMLVALSGCSATDVSNRKVYQGPKLPKPGRIIVHDFAASPAELPRWSNIARVYGSAGAAGDPETARLGRELGRAIAERLVEEIHDMGLSAASAVATRPSEPGDIVLVGAILGVDEGSRTKRLLVGFGSGSSSMSVEVEGYQRTGRGIAFLGSGSVEAGGSGKGPGMVVPLAVTIATANPIGLAVSGAAKAQGEMSGRTTIEGSAKKIAKRIAAELEVAFQRQGWI